MGRFSILSSQNTRSRAKSWRRIKTRYIQMRADQTAADEREDVIKWQNIENWRFIVQSSFAIICRRNSVVDLFSDSENLCYKIFPHFWKWINQKTWLRDFEPKRGWNAITQLPLACRLCPTWIEYSPLNARRFWLPWVSSALMNLVILRSKESFVRTWRLAKLFPVNRKRNWSVIVKVENNFIKQGNVGRVKVKLNRI